MALVKFESITQGDSYIDPEIVTAVFPSPLDSQFTGIRLQGGGVVTVGYPAKEVFARLFPEKNLDLKNKDKQMDFTTCYVVFGLIALGVVIGVAAMCLVQINRINVISRKDIEALGMASGFLHRACALDHAKSVERVWRALGGGK